MNETVLRVVGPNGKPGGEGLSLAWYERPDVQVVRDIGTRCFPLSSGTMDEVVLDNAIDYLDDWPHLLNECHRVLKPEGKVSVRGSLDTALFSAMARATGMEKAALGLRCAFEETNEWGLALRSESERSGGARPLLTRPGIALHNGHPSCVRVELGCGSRKRGVPGPFIGVDRHEYPGVDEVADIERGLPFHDGSVDFVFASHLMEHIGDLIFAMEEIWRVLRNRGIFEMINPWWNSMYAFVNPDHKRVLHNDLWSYWSSQGNIMDKEAYGIKARFDVVSNSHMGDGNFVTLEAEK